MSSPSEQTILITGANSYVAGHILVKALSKGYHIRGTVRSESSASKLRDLFPQYASQLSVAIVPDMTKTENYESAFAGTAKPITGIIHVASPFDLKTTDIAGGLLDPAVQGAVTILEAAKRYGPDVRRVVNTSSFASVVDIGKGYRPGYTYTEKDWNPMTYDEALTADITGAYCASKGLAERAMWDWLEKEKPSFTMASINPPWVFGPHAVGLPNIKKLNESSQLLWELVDNDKVPATDFAGFADARVLASALIAAVENPDAAGERFLVASHFDYQTAVDIIRAEIPELRNRVPEGRPGYGKIEKVYKIDGSKAEKVLGITYIPIEQTVKDSMLQLLEAEKA